jgi:uncharacterized protein YjiS (DUF1127 family)
MCVEAIKQLVIIAGVIVMETPRARHAYQKTRVRRELIQKMREALTDIGVDFEQVKQMRKQIIQGGGSC